MLAFYITLLSNFQAFSLSDGMFQNLFKSAPENQMIVESFVLFLKNKANEKMGQAELYFPKHYS